MASAAPSPPSSPSSSEPIPIESVELKPLIKVRGATGKAEGKTKQEGGADGVRGAIGGAMDAVRDGLSDNLRNIRRATAGVIIVSTVGALYFSRPVRYASTQADLALVRPHDQQSQTHLTPTNTGVAACLFAQMLRYKNASDIPARLWSKRRKLRVSVMTASDSGVLHVYHWPYV